MLKGAALGALGLGGAPGAAVGAAIGRWLAGRNANHESPIYQDPRALVQLLADLRFVRTSSRSAEEGFYIHKNSELNEKLRVLLDTVARAVRDTMDKQEISERDLELMHEHIKHQMPR